MLRLETENGWWLITHPDHARLAAAFAERWGNGEFSPPKPRSHVLKAIAEHDDGWAARDRNPQTTGQGKPSAFSTDLVGKYAAFEEIDLTDYLAVRERAVTLVATEDAYAGLLVSMHTHNLLHERADRSTIAPEQLPLLDEFLAKQRRLQEELRQTVRRDEQLDAEERSDAGIVDNFRLLQATDNLSLLSCVSYGKSAGLLHPLRLRSGSESRVQVEPIGERRFRLRPYPFDTATITFMFPAKHVTGKTFVAASELRAAYSAAATETLSVIVRQ